MSEGNHLANFFQSVRSRNLGIVETGDAALSQVYNNVGDFRRRIHGIVRVQNKYALPGIVEEANRCSVVIYPYSCGRNWGYGSKLPAQNNAVLLDLSGLNQIIAINEEHGIATIEPGVTQRQLADELQRLGSRYYLDVTGSGAETSIVGNSLERGIAYGSLRVQQISGMEILLGDGTQFRTGFGGYPNPVLAGLYSYGLGPSLDGLFFQSNFGIVLEAELQLSLRPKKLFALSVAIQNKNLGKFVDTVAELLRQDYLHGIPHLANRERTVSTIAPLIADRSGHSVAAARELVNRVLPKDWVLTASIAGHPTIAKKKLKQVKIALKPLGRIYVHEFDNDCLKGRMLSWIFELLANQEQKLMIAATAELRAFHQGYPSDAGIRFLQGSPSGAVDDSPEGFLLCTPIAPLAGSSAEVFEQVVHQQAEKHGVRLAMTQNMLNSRVLEAVVSAHYRRDSEEQREKAHCCVDEMTSLFSEKGFYPYRVNIDQQSRFLQQSPQQLKTLRSLQKVLDPNGIIAPGRY